MRSSTNRPTSISWRCHAMKAHSTLLALYEGNPPVTGWFPPKDHYCRALIFSLFLGLTNCWTNSSWWFGMACLSRDVTDITITSHNGSATDLAWTSPRYYNHCYVPLYWDMWERSIVRIHPHMRKWVCFINHNKTVKDEGKGIVTNDV